MEKINLTLCVSVDVAMKLLQVLKESQNEEDFIEIPLAPMPEPVKTVEPVKPKVVEPTTATLDDVRHAFVELSQKKGKDIAKQVIAGLGFKRVTEIPPEMFNTALDKVKEAL